MTKRPSIEANIKVAIPDADAIRDNVILFHSDKGGVWKTRAIYEFINTFIENESDKSSKGLIVDAAFQDQLSSYLGIPERKENTFDLPKISSLKAVPSLDQIVLSLTENHFDPETFFDQINLNNGIVKYRDHLDLLLSFGYSSLIDPYRSQMEVANVIKGLKNKYDFLLVDTPAGVVGSFLSLFATVNSVIVFLPADDIHQFIRSLWKIDRMVVRFKLNRFPIDINGIVPVYFDSEKSFIRKHQGFLNETFEKNIIWDPIISEPNFFKLSNWGRSFFDKVMETTRSKHKKLPISRVPIAKEIISYIDNEEQSPSYTKIAMKFLEKIKQHRKKDESVTYVEADRRYVINLLRELTIFRNKIFFGEGGAE